MAEGCASVLSYVGGGGSDIYHHIDGLFWHASRQYSLHPGCRHWLLRAWVLASSDGVQPAGKWTLRAVSSVHEGCSPCPNRWELVALSGMGHIRSVLSPEGWPGVSSTVGPVVLRSQMLHSAGSWRPSSIPVSGWRVFLSPRSSLCALVVFFKGPADS